jgi:hypothetical protein
MSSDDRPVTNEKPEAAADEDLLQPEQVLDGDRLVEDPSWAAQLVVQRLDVSRRQPPWFRRLKSSRVDRVDRAPAASG